MKESFIRNIALDKNLSLIKDIETLHIYEKINDYNYKDIIGFKYIKESMAEWKKVEGKFISEVEKIILKVENEFSIEPYLIFFIDIDKYYESLEEIVKLERDEFYCRKFVYPLSNEETIIEKLPFGNPLTFKKQRQNFISAEKTLINLGIERDKAKTLTRKSISDQLKKQLIDYFKNLEIKSKSIDLTYKESTIKNYVRLKEMEVEGFRIYGKKEVFDLDADLIVLYGANGLGKTSFFDAFEYGVTEEIKRFSNRNDRTNIERLVKNFAIEDSDKCRVKIKFEVLMENSTKDFSIERTMGNSKVDSQFPEGTIKKIETRELLNKITQKNIFLKKDEVVRLFRATHINNQGDSELTENVISGSSTISNEILGKMISFEDYTDVEKNLENIIDRNNKIIKNELENIMQSLIKNTEELKNKFESQQSILINGESSETLLNLENELKIKIREDLNIVPYKLQKDYIRNEVSSKIEAELRVIQDEIDNAQDAVRMKPEFIRLKDENNKLDLENIRLTVKRVQGDLVKIDEKKKDAELSRETNELKLKEKERLLQEGDRYSEICLIRDRISTDIEMLDKQRNEVTLGIDTIQKRLRDINKKESNRVEEFLIIDRELYSIQEEIKNIETLSIEFDKYIAETERKKLLSEKIGYYSKEIEEKSKNKKEINQQISTFNIKINALEMEMEQERTDNGELENLLLAMKKYVRGNSCPVCGSIHEKQEGILQIIDKRLNNISEKQKKKYQQIVILKEDKEMHQKLYVDINSNIQNLKSNYDELIKEIETIEISSEKFILRINELGIACNKNDFNILLNKTRDKERGALEKLKENLASENEYQMKFENIQKELLGKNTELKEIDANNLTLRSKLDAWNKELLKLENLEMFNSIQFGNPKQRLNFIEQLNKEIEKIKVLIKELNENINSLRNYRESHLKELVKLQRDLEYGIKINNDYKKIESQLQIIRDVKKVDIDNIDTFYKERVERLSILTSLKSKVITFLKISEFESLSIEQKELELKIIANEKEIEDIEKKINDYRRINKKIEEVQKEIKSAQYNIVNNYCKNVEPLVSIIQNRLRALYGFSDLTLSLDKGKDEVNIKTSHYALEQKEECDNVVSGKEPGGKKDLKPYQYFSEAQKNIINLSLFLSNTLSQNWSGFRTIFLDDPVQHFDDLNAYAFLELLKSLILDNDKNERKQIIISTCDNRLFNLIREKFVLLKKNDRAKYYVFESISKDGPVIKSL